MLTRISGITNRVQAVHFNRLNGESATHASTPSVWRHHHLPTRQIPDETDLMCMDETGADVESWNSSSSRTNRPRQEVQAPVWTGDCFLISELSLLIRHRVK